jgi:hypothetical protein
VPRPVLKLINGPGKINGAENTTSPALISRGKVATGGGTARPGETGLGVGGGFTSPRVRKEIVSAPFLTVRRVRSANRHETLKRERKGDVRSR